MRRTLILVPLILASCDAEPSRLVAVGQAARAAARTGTAAIFRDDGSLERPHGYRTWVHVGTPLTPNDMNDGHAPFPEFHTVYVDPVSYEAYKQTGAWRDGTVFIKELTGVGAKAATSGNGYFQGEFIGLEASVKSAERFAQEPGHWGYFRFTDEGGGPVRRVAQAQPTMACAACHQSSAKDDLVFTQYYPMLRAAKRAGSTIPEDG